MSTGQAIISGETGEAVRYEMSTEDGMTENAVIPEERKRQQKAKMIAAKMIIAKMIAHLRKPSHSGSVSRRIMVFLKTAECWNGAPTSASPLAGHLWYCIPH